MNKANKVRLQSAGWVIGDAAEFLRLTPQEARFVGMQSALARGVREYRERLGLTQAALADRLGSSQSRVAKMEAGHRSVSLELMMRSLLKMGATAGDIATLIKRAERQRGA